MTFAEQIIALLNPPTNGRVFFLTADLEPNQVKVAPFAIIQRVGGKEFWYLDQVRPETQHVRLQVFSWGTDVIAVEQFHQAVADAIRTGTMPSEPYGGARDDFQKELGLYGLRQDFGVHFNI